MPCSPCAPVFPTRVGVFLSMRTFAISSPQYSPRVWGCFLPCHPHTRFLSVFPTRVGVFLQITCEIGYDFGIPHACGGVSQTPSAPFVWQPYSPRVWGCFLAKHNKNMLGRVFPTRVGVFLSRREERDERLSIPHACGGVSWQDLHCSSDGRYSPRVWGCFPVALATYPSMKVFPTRVGVFLVCVIVFFRDICIPHACGGVSSFGLSPTVTN